MNHYDIAAEKLDISKILTRIQSFAVSEPGKEAILQIKPISSLQLISKEHDRVTEMKGLVESGVTLPIYGIKDIRLAVKRTSINNLVLSQKELINISATLQVAKNLKKIIEIKNNNLSELNEITSEISIDNEVLYNINQAIDENTSIKDTASKSLRSIRQSITAKQQSIRRALERILRATAEQGIVQDEIVTTRDGRMVIPIKTELKNKFPGFIHSTSASGQTVFIEPTETLTLNNEITELFFEEQREITRILLELTDQVRKIAPALIKIIYALILIDSCYAKAIYSIEIKGNKPLLKDIGSIVIRDGYHPILLLRHKRETVVPLNIEVGAKFKTVLITGPNAGGKTVTLKTIGILSLMVQSGIHVPVSPDTEFPIFSKIFVLIGDNQSIDNDLSTFSSQMLKVKEIIENADSKSLVLIDEIGSNTDPAEGGAIAASILQHLSSSDVYTIATSHQAALKAFVHSENGMENGAMEFDQESLLPTYKFKLGIPGSSYAIEIAQRIGLQDSLISKAKYYLGGQQSKLEHLILDLENRSHELEQKHAESAIELLKYKELTQTYRSKLSQFDSEIKAIKINAIEKAKDIVAGATKTIELTVQEIKNRQADRDVIREAKNKIALLASDIENLDMDNSKTVTTEKFLNIQINDNVVLKSGNQTGLVISVPDKNGNLLVAFNTIKAKVHISDIQIAPRKEAISSSVSSFISIEKDYSSEIDIRGYFSDDAIPEVDKFIDNAILLGLQKISIIHGHGTGALRKSIHSYLQDDQRLKSYRFGERDEGGAGITIIELI